MDLRRKHPFFWFVIVYGSLVTAVFVAVGVAVYRYGSTQIDTGWEYECQKDNCFVKRVDARGPATQKLEPGDQIIEVNHDRNFARVGIWSDTLLILEPLQSYSLRIKRGVSEFDVQLYGNARRDTHRLVSILILFFAALVSLACAIWIGLLKPDQKTTQLFTLTWLSGSLIQTLPVMNLMQYDFGQGELRLISLIWFLAVSPMPIATGFHFYYRFPPGISESRFWTNVKRGIYAWSISLAGLFTIIRAILLWDPRQGAQFVFKEYSFITALEKLIPLVNLVVLPALTMVVARNYRLVQDADQRRRIKWVVYSSILGLLPFIVYSVIDYAFRARLPFAPTRAAHDNWFLISNFALVLIPFTTAYAIVKNRMFEIQVVVRKGVQYLFAKKILQVFIYLPAILLFIALRAQRHRSVPEVIFSHWFYIFILIAAAAGLIFRRRLLEALDRSFFREAYNSEKILMNLGEEIKNFNSMSEVAEWVSSQLKSALHPKQIFVHYRQKERGAFVLGYSSNERPEAKQVSEQSEWIRILEMEGKSQNFQSSGNHQLPLEEKNWMDQLGIHLAVPMMGSGEHAKGVLLLGEKRSEEPYSAADRRLLEALAGQMAILHENLLLKEKVDEGNRVQRNVLAHLSAEKRNLLKECPRCGTCFDSNEQICNQDGAELILTLPVERTIEGKYRLKARIGKGGMGAVYRATDLRLSRDIAMKILMGSMFGDSHAIRRFEREARASARLQHPNIITIHDFGGIGQGAYLAMELLDGYTLRASLQQSGNLSPTLAAKWFDQILEGVKAAHQLGVIHRDLKPENVFVSKGQKNLSVLKILDFGLAKMKAIDAVKSGTLTAPGTAMGTLHYMSPEQITAAEIDERTDIFSLGVMVIEALTGSLPFNGNTTTDVALAILQEDYRLEGDSPERKRLDAVLQKCIAKRPRDRYASVSEMQNHLIEAIAAVQPFSAPRRSDDSAATGTLTNL